MDRWAWPTTIKVIVGLMVAGMVAASVLFVVQVYELTGPFPAETGVFVDDISAGNEYITARYRAGLRAGCAVRARVRGARAARTAASSARRPQRQPWTDPARDADAGRGSGCGRAAPQHRRHPGCDEHAVLRMRSAGRGAHVAPDGLQHRARHSDLAHQRGDSSRRRPVFLIAARPGVRAGMPVGWAYLGYFTALASAVVVVLWAFSRDTFPFNLWSLVVLAAVLLPAWAIWLAMRSEDLRLGGQEVDLLQGG